MSHVMLHRTDNGNTIQCATPTTGATLLSVLDQERLTIASVKPLNNGTAFRRYRFVKCDSTLYDLTEYQELYNAQHALFARIDMAQERML